MEVRVHYTRPGKGTSVYVDDLVRDDGRAMVTYTVLPPASGQAIAQALWQQRLVAAPVQISAVRKHHLYGEHFAILEWFDPAGSLIGYYSDMVTPLRREHGEYYLTDLFLDVWLAPGQPARGLDEDEFAAAVAAGLISAEQQAGALAAYARVQSEIASGVFPFHYLRA